MLRRHGGPASGPVGVLVNNAGGVEGPGFPAARPADWQFTLDLNLRAVMLAAQLVLRPDGPSAAAAPSSTVASVRRAGHDQP